MLHETTSTPPDTPTRPLEWFIFAWGVLGVVFIIGQAIVRLSPNALAVADFELSFVHWTVGSLWAAFMLYSEGWRGFHLQFSPRVVARTLGLLRAPHRRWSPVAPIVAMGLVYGTARRLRISRTLMLGIVVLVLIVRQVPQPWRGIIDIGVVLGLVFGVLSIVVHAVRASLGHPPGTPLEFPDASDRE